MSPLGETDVTLMNLVFPAKQAVVIIQMHVRGVGVGVVNVLNG